MPVGFSGTAKGMTRAQRDSVRELLAQQRSTETMFHHGDCVGADAEAHEMAVVLGYDIIIHPPIHEHARAFCDRVDGGILVHRPPFEYIERNQHIVNETTMLIAAPEVMPERLRSGTWSTVRKARKKGIPIYLVAQSGAIIKEGHV